jgi:hypothetical protein
MGNLVYFDMDGVLADFDYAYDHLIGKPQDLWGVWVWAWPQFCLPSGDFHTPSPDHLVKDALQMQAVRTAILTCKIIWCGRIPTIK